MTAREQARIDRLLADLGHTSVIDALRHAKRMQMALKVIHTWMSMPDMHTPKQIEAVCATALGKESAYGPR